MTSTVMPAIDGETIPGRDLAAPSVVVLSSLFPHQDEPMAGLFIRERMFRVGRCLALSVVSPKPWFPAQRLLRRWKPSFRPNAPKHERQSGHDVWFPRFFSVPALFKRLDGMFMAWGAHARCAQLQRQGRLDLLDAHFAYPDGDAAYRLAKRLNVPYTVTLRGTEARLLNDASIRPLMLRALSQAARVFAVSESLRAVALSMGVPPEHVEVVGNGVDLQRFFPEPRDAARAALGLPNDASVLVTVGGLVERKGFHRVLACLPALREQFPKLHYLLVGGPSPEGDMTEALKAQVRELGLESCTRFLGPTAPDRLRHVLSAADVFVLSTRNEGWANVFLEAMACGLPVVTTDVGGNREVVRSDALGTVLPFDDHAALVQALGQALVGTWDRTLIRRYAQDNTWDRRVQRLHECFVALTNRVSITPTVPAAFEQRANMSTPKP